MTFRIFNTDRLQQVEAYVRWYTWQ